MVQHCKPVVSWGLPGLVLILLAPLGCSQSKNLVYRQNTVIGLEVSANPEGTSGKAVFGYDRETNAVVPKKPKAEGGELQTGGMEAMSTISISHIQIGFVEASCIYEAFATGDAANDLAANPQSMNDFLSGSGMGQNANHPAPHCSDQ